MLRDDAAVYNKKNRLENLFINLEKTLSCHNGEP